MWAYNCIIPSCRLETVVGGACTSSNAIKIISVAVDNNFYKIKAECVIKLTVMVQLCGAAIIIATILV